MFLSHIYKDEVRRLLRVRAGEKDRTDQAMRFKLQGMDSAKEQWHHRRMKREGTLGQRQSLWGSVDGLTGD